VESLVHDYGLVVLFLLIAMESAGIPLPGETALVAAGVFASHGDMDIVAVIVVAAVAAIVGDNVGYWAGRLGGRKLLRRWRWLEHHAARVLPWSERFFMRHGAKTIFFGRFFAILRVTAAWLAGVSEMHWWRFFLYNALGGICWAVLVGLVAYFAGHAAADAISRYGLYGGVAIVVVLAVGAIVYRFVKRRMLRAESEA
jgi:membrane protein DedA with SNARE-associated domain